jgi:uncharacterized protein with PQ loop repeat
VCRFLFSLLFGDNCHPIVLYNVGKKKKKSIRRISCDQVWYHLHACTLRLIHTIVCKEIAKKLQPRTPMPLSVVCVCMRESHIVCHVIILLPESHSWRGGTAAT